MHKAWFLGLAGAAAVALGTGVSYAAVPDGNGVIHGCYSPNGSKATNGTQLNIVDTARASCNGAQQEIAWNQTGPQGPAGSKGDKGDPGPAGTFSGAFQSPDGDYSISVTDNGIQLTGPTGAIQIGSSGVLLNAGGSKISIDQLGAVKVDGAHDVTIQGDANVELQAGAQATVAGTVTNVNGGVVQLNGCARQVSGTTDQIVGSESGGVVTGGIVTGSQTVCEG